MEYTNFFEQDESHLESEVIMEYDITTSPRDLTPANIVDLIDSGIIEMPLFQRNYVWNIKTASRLIESMILGLPVPELFFFSESDENDTYKVIDGQQRLLSVYFFMKGRFPKSDISRLNFRKSLANWSNEEKREELLGDDEYFTDFALSLRSNDKAPSVRYDGETFKKLDKEMQIKFRLRRYLRTVVIRQNKPFDNDSAMYEIFNRLNTGGAKLTAQEIRASLYYCDFYKSLVELNGNEKWRALLGNPTEYLRSYDVEIILRCLALLAKGDSYTPSMLSFLNRFSFDSKRFKTSYIEYLCKVFVSFVDACALLPPKAFFRNNRFSPTVLESIFVAVCRPAFLSDSIVAQKIDPGSFDSLMQNNTFNDLLLRGTSQTENIKSRVEEAEKTIVLQ